LHRHHSLAERQAPLHSASHHSPILALTGAGVNGATP